MPFIRCEVYNRIFNKIVRFTANCPYLISFYNHGILLLSLMYSQEVILGLVKILDCEHLEHTVNGWSGTGILKD